MTERKFTPPIEFPAEYVDGYGRKVVILGRSNNLSYPLVGYTKNGLAESWTEQGGFNGDRIGDHIFNLHDIPKRITTWQNVYKTHMSESYASRSTADGYAWESRLCVYRLERDEDGGNLKTFMEEV